MPSAIPPLLADSAQQRRMMVDRQVRTFDVTDQIVIARMLQVPREWFVEPAQAALAYSDGTLDLAGAAGPRTRSLLAPFALARMMQAAAAEPDDRVLDLAGGTGYTAALFAGLAREVVAIEPDGVLSARAGALFAALGLDNAKAVSAPLPQGAAGHGSFDIIFVNGCAEAGLSPLAALLSARGRIISIVPKPSGATAAAEIAGRGDDLSVRPLFDAQARPLAEFRRAPAFAF